jgi:hypothetical protein
MQRKGRWLLTPRSVPGRSLQPCGGRPGGKCGGRVSSSITW